MRKRKGEATSSFNKRFVSFYYGMPKEIHPLEGAMKLHFASVFPPDLSLFRLEIKSTSLQRMFADALDIEENFRLLGKILDQGGINKKDMDLGRVEVHHETEKKLPW